MLRKVQLFIGTPGPQTSSTTPPGIQDGRFNVDFQLLKSVIKDFYDNFAIPADSIARTVAFAIEQPEDVDVNEIVIRPTAQEF